MNLKIALIVILCTSYLPSVSDSETIKRSPVTVIDYVVAKKQFTWLNKRFFTYLNHRCKQKGIEVLYALSVVQVESRGKNVVSRKNGNNTRDYGYFQINSVHCPKNPRKLLNYRVNINKGLWYLGLCLKKSKGDKFLACIYYNGGLNCNVKRYKRRHIAYPTRILTVYTQKSLNTLNFCYLYTCYFVSKLSKRG